MRRFFVLCTCLGLIAPITLGCQDKKKEPAKPAAGSGDTKSTGDAAPPEKDNK